MNFLVKIIALFIIIVAISFLVYLLRIHTYILPNKDVYIAIERSKENTPSTTLLIIGDSVGKQLFEDLNKNDTITSLACNQAIDFVGHYILLEEYLRNNPNIEKILMIYNPLGFMNNLNHKYTYNYFLKPFYNQGYFQYIDSHVQNQVKKLPFYQLANFPLINITFWTPDYLPPYREEDKIIDTSQTTEIYLEKIVKLAEERDISFQLSSPPIKSSHKYLVEAGKKRILEKAQEPLRPIFAKFFNSIVYLPDSAFRDRLHLKRPDYFQDRMLDRYLTKQSSRAPISGT